MARKLEKANKRVSLKDRRKGRPRDRREPGPEDNPRKVPCLEMRLVIIVGRSDDRDLAGAVKWAEDRAEALGGTMHMWRSLDSQSPLQSFRSTDLSDGDIRPDPTTYERSGNSHNFAALLPALHDCRGRITELVIIHHGVSVDEFELADELLRIFAAIQVPVCRVVWWSCRAAASLKLEEGKWTDRFMRRMGRYTRCRPCGCGEMIELIWPTAGKCGINEPDDPAALLTGTGKVHRLRWGYPQPGGGLGPRPPEDMQQHTMDPPERDLPYDQPIPEVDGVMVFGVPVRREAL